MRSSHVGPSHRGPCKCTCTLLGYSCAYPLSPYMHRRDNQHRPNPPSARPYSKRCAAYRLACCTIHQPYKELKRPCMAQQHRTLPASAVACHGARGRQPLEHQHAPACMHVVSQSECFTAAQLGDELLRACRPQSIKRACHSSNRGNGQTGPGQAPHLHMYVPWKHFFPGPTRPCKAVACLPHLCSPHRQGRYGVNHGSNTVGR